LIIQNLEKENTELLSKLEFLENEKVKETTQQYKLIKANEVKELLLEKKQVQKELLYLELKKELKSADKEIANLKKTISELVTKIHRKD